jgi:hypothetical protein
VVFVDVEELEVLEDAALCQRLGVESFDAWTQFR